MCSNHSSTKFIQMVLSNPDKLGWLLGPSSYKRPKIGVPFALDNDAYTNWKKGAPFNYPGWVTFLDKIRNTGMSPLWCAVPDAVANRQETLRLWARYSSVAGCYGWPLAFVVQDGMTPVDIPKTASVIFVGGSTSWKWKTISMWVSAHPRVHVGRCGTSRWKLDRLESLGVESCDGSGFFRATMGGREARQLIGWLDKTDHQMEFTT